ncbi:hypothetical protein EVAR_8413_1 [Eumeta japonica]|uniref:Uncharacterized protein n=1 Tax=Eumeta variegata TaxID=151549 RepID=A0A4C1WFA6_EUMVA|nr:hypothetical protein EVAR_8413_1 [Eumeta japonica]
MYFMKEDKRGKGEKYLFFITLQSAQPPLGAVGVLERSAGTSALGHVRRFAPINLSRTSNPRPRSDWARAPTPPALSTPRLPRRRSINDVSKPLRRAHATEPPDCAVMGTFLLQRRTKGVTARTNSRRAVSGFGIIRFSTVPVPQMSTDGSPTPRRPGHSPRPHPCEGRRAPAQTRSSQKSDFRYRFPTIRHDPEISHKSGARVAINGISCRHRTMRESATAQGFFVCSGNDFICSQTFDRTRCKGKTARPQLAFDDEAPSLSSVCFWFSQFRRGGEQLFDDLREERPVTAVN